MTVEQLIDELSCMPPKAEIRIMVQPLYPFENDVKGIWQPDEDSDDHDKCPNFAAHGEKLCEDEECDHCDTIRENKADEFKPEGNPKDGVIYILEGAQLGYGTKRAWEN